MRTVLPLTTGGIIGSVPCACQGALAPGDDTELAGFSTESPRARRTPSRRVDPAGQADRMIPISFKKTTYDLCRHLATTPATMSATAGITPARIRILLQ